MSFLDFRALFPSTFSLFRYLEQEAGVVTGRQRLYESVVHSRLLLLLIVIPSIGLSLVRGTPFPFSPKQRRHGGSGHGLVRFSRKELGAIVLVSAVLSQYALLMCQGKTMEAIVHG